MGVVVTERRTRLSDDEDADESGGGSDAPRHGYFWNPMSSIPGAERVPSGTRSMWYTSTASTSLSTTICCVIVCTVGG